MTEAVRGPVSLRTVKSIIKNLKISSSPKYGSEVPKIVRHFKLFGVVLACNTHSHMIIEFLAKTAGIHLEEVIVKQPYTVVLETRLRPKLN